MISLKTGVYYLLLILALAVTGCTTAAVTTPEPTITSTEDRFIFGMVLVGPEDDQGWSEAHLHAGEYVEAHLTGTRLLVLDNLNPEARPAMSLEQVVDDMVAQGAAMILVTSDDFGADILEVAQKYPDVYFVQDTGDQVLREEAPTNLANYMPRMYYGKMIAGCAAALATQTGHLGYVGALINDETRRHANATYLGARYCYEHFREQEPDSLQFGVEWVGYWFHIPGVTEDPIKLAKFLVARGADVLISGIDTTEVLEQAAVHAEEGAAILAIPFNYEGGCDIAPDVCLGVPYYNWRPGYLELTEAAQQGEEESYWLWDEPVWEQFDNIEVNPVGFRKGPALSASQSEQLDTFIQGLADGSIVLFQGPLRFQNSFLYLQEGEVASDEKIWEMPQLLQGMEGLSE